MIDTKQCGWHVAEKEIVNGFKRPYIQIDEPDLAIQMERLHHQSELR